MHISLGLKIANVDDRSRGSLLKALTQLGESDNDFCGENGYEYIWERVWQENGFKSYEDWQSKNEPDLLYESNLKYAIEQVRNIEDDMKCIEEFLKEWLDHDSYYLSYEWECIKDSEENLVAITLATVVGS